MATPSTPPAVLIAVDWGAQHLRAWQMDATGNVLDHRHLHGGIDMVAEGQFAEVLRSALGAWLNDDITVVMSGMVGSRQGWKEASYVTCPAGLEALAQRLSVVPFDVPCWIVPGMCQSVEGRFDVMRGEETQLVGANSPDGLYIFPGRHSKWVQVFAEQVVWFQTFMTGEMLQVLCPDSRASVGQASSHHNEVLDARAFASGVKQSTTRGGLLEKLCNVRARWLFGELAEHAQNALVAGLLVGTEVLDGLAAIAAYQGHGNPGRITLMASHAVAKPYADALLGQGLSASIQTDNRTANGIWRIADHAGVLRSKSLRYTSRLAPDIGT